MTDLDLTEALEAAAKTAYERGGSSWDEQGGSIKHAWREAYLDVVAAVAPIIAAQAVANTHTCGTGCLCGGRCAEVEILRDLIARSSLGSPEAAALRESVQPELAERALRRAAEMERDAAIAERDALRDRILALADSLKEENR